MKNEIIAFYKESNRKEMRGAFARLKKRMQEKRIGHKPPSHSRDKKKGTLVHMVCLNIRAQNSKKKRNQRARVRAKKVIRMSREV